MVLNISNQIEAIDRDDKVNSYCMESGSMLSGYNNIRGVTSHLQLCSSETYDVIKVLFNPESDY